jgi:DNA-binding transcriptional ArsR family regulator
MDPQPDRPAGADTLPHRELSDPRALRAIAHPVRLAILEQLAIVGPSTATELADQLGDQSPANCSWHLRQLAQYGFIEQVDSGPGRQRRWRVVVESTSIPESGAAAPELGIAADAFDQTLLERALANRRAWQATRREEPLHWREAALSSHSWAWMTADEVAEFTAEFSALVERYALPTVDRVDPARRPAGARPVQLVAWLVPVGPETPDADVNDPREETA